MPDTMQPGNMLRALAPRSPRLECLGGLLRAHVASGSVAGAVALVARPDGMHVEEAGVQDIAAWRAMLPDSIFRIASMTKPIIAAAAMLLVEEGRIGLDDPVERWLPELASRRVLRSVESTLDDTVPARRAITLDDLLTFRLGLGVVIAPPGRYPIQRAMAELGVAPGTRQLDCNPDEFMARIGRLPLIHQPGEGWMYHTGADILAVLIARLAAMPLGHFLQERIFAPLSMRDTGFSVAAGSLVRLATCYELSASGELEVCDPAIAGSYSVPPLFPNALVSTVSDYLCFARMLLNRGEYAGRRILARESVDRMMRDHLTEEQKASSPFSPGFWDRYGWGYGGAVVTNAGPCAPRLGSYGWVGGFGTSFLVDPRANLITIVMSQRLMRASDDCALTNDVQSLVYRGLDA